MEDVLRLLFVRHGESGWNRARLVQGQSPAAPGLTSAGRAQAAAAAAALADSGAGLLLASDLRRAAETAEPIAARLGLPVRLEPRLRERAFGVAEGRPGSELTQAQTGLGAGLVTGPDARPAGGESLRDLCQRVAGLLGGLLAAGPARPVVLVTHGGTIRAAQAWLAGVPVDGMPWQDVPNAAVLAVPVPLRARR